MGGRKVIEESSLVRRGCYEHISNLEVGHDGTDVDRTL